MGSTVLSDVPPEPTSPSTPTHPQPTSGLSPSPTARTLSKSDYILARTCAAKLFFRENGYPDRRDSNPYLALLAEGGYMVEALAKARYADGVQLEYGRNVGDDYVRTLDHLRRDRVTLFEAALLVGRRQARVDILDKQGNTIRLLEVKSRSFDGAEHERLKADGKFGVFRGKKKPHGILGDWLAKLEDLTYQVVLLEKLLPGVVVKPFLVLVDKSKVSSLDNVPSLFELARRTSSDGSTRVHTARYIGTREQLDELDLVTEVDVSDEVAMLREAVERYSHHFEARLDAPLSAFTLGVERGSKCSVCEFRVHESAEKSGFNDCWGPLAHPKPHMLELYSIGTCKAPDRSPLIEWMVAQDKASLFDIPEACLCLKDGTVGITAERQRRQIDCTRRNEVFVSPDLRRNIESLQGPLNFIDFETSRLALPYHRGMGPYGLVTFQWSCHTVASHGKKPAHAEWLNDKDVWPNRAFAESLRAAIGDSGPVLTWSHFEASTLREVVADLDRFGHDCPELVEWITDVFEHRIVDMHEWARRDYYHPGMKGRTSIKVVLDALWKSDPVMRAQFGEWTLWAAEESRDPYACLPAVEIAGTLQDVHEGTGAMRAYQEMMYGAEKNDPVTKAMWSALLRRYCELDTMSMVLILEHWRRWVGLGV